MAIEEIEEEELEQCGSIPLDLMRPRLYRSYYYGYSTDNKTAQC